MATYATPMDDIGTLVGRCSDLQMPEHVREAARRTRRWLEGLDPDGIEEADEEDDGSDLEDEED